MSTTIKFETEWGHLVTQVHSSITQLRDAPAEERQYRHDQALSALYALTGLHHQLDNQGESLGYWKGVEALHRGEIRVVVDEPGHFKVEGCE